MAKLYIASLADYNSGRLHGKWIDLEDFDTFEEIMDELLKLFLSSPYFKEYVWELENIDITKIDEEEARKLFNNYFEWAIHDYEGFGNLDIHEYAGLEEVFNKGKLYEELTPELEAFIEYKADLGNHDYMQDIDYDIEVLKNDYHEKIVATGESHNDVFENYIAEHGGVLNAFGLETAIYWFDDDEYLEGMKDDITSDSEEYEWMESLESGEQYIEEVYGDYHTFLEEYPEILERHIDVDKAVRNLEIESWDFIQMDNRDYIAFYKN